MNIFEAPENYVYYNGVTTAKVLYVQDEIPNGWVLVNTNKNTVGKIVDDGLSNEFWDSLQQSGNRKDYSYAFCNSAYKCLSPQYPIFAENVMYALMSCSNLEDASNILINITSQKPNMMYTCANCSSMIKAPMFNFINVPVVKTYISMYAGCYKLQSAEVYWGDGTVDPITQRNACQNMFFKCWGLIDIDFGEEETGSPLNLDLSYAKGLTVASVQSLLSSLKTIPAGSAGKYEIVIASETYKMLSEYEDVLEGFATKGWTLSHETREETVLESEE